MDKRIIYSSRGTFDLATHELVGLLRTSRANNERRDLTGMLLYSGQSFLQVLEGEADAVHRCFATIVRDSRHFEIRLLLNRRISERLFPDWTMGFEHLDRGDLLRDVPGFTTLGPYPFLNPSLITNGRVAERLLSIYAHTRDTVNAA